MNRVQGLTNFVLHMQQKVVQRGSWPRCAVKEPWKLSMNPIQSIFSHREHPDCENG